MLPLRPSTPYASGFFSLHTFSITSHFVGRLWLQALLLWLIVVSHLPNQPPPPLPFLDSLALRPCLRLGNPSTAGNKLRHLIASAHLVGTSKARD